MESKSQAQERQIATRLRSIYGRGRSQPGSGNQATAPNDVAVTGKLHIEAKETSFKAMNVQYEWLQKASRKALQFGVRAHLAIRFSTYDKRDFFIIEEDEYYDLIACREELHARQ